MYGIDKCPDCSDWKTRSARRCMKCAARARCLRHPSPRPYVPCPDCGGPKSKPAKRCRDCARIARRSGSPDLYICSTAGKTNGGKASDVFTAYCLRARIAKQGASGIIGAGGALVAARRPEPRVLPAMAVRPCRSAQAAVGSVSVANAVPAVCRSIRGRDSASRFLTTNHWPLLPL